MFPWRGEEEGDAVAAENVFVMGLFQFRAPTRRRY